MVVSITVSSVYSLNPFPVAEDVKATWSSAVPPVIPIDHIAIVG